MNNENTEAFEPKIIQVDIENEMKKSFLDYSMSVIVSRALPDVRDGLKPVHRRILYSQYEDNLGPDKPYKKCATTVGNVLGRYHPHGDASVYDALVRLAQDFSMRYMLVDGHGNFGSVDGDPPAAYRYTEARMSKISVEMLTDIDKNTVDFAPNYDDSRKEPTVLPSRFPNLLVNGSMGIAVGMATNIPPHNLREVTDAVCALIDNPDIELFELMEHIKGPDFPTGGLIMGKSGIRSAYATGRGKVIVRAKAEIIEKKNGRFKIVVTELPYQVNKARLIENIADMVKDKRLDGITNIDDHSDRKGMHIEIDLRKDVSPQIMLNKLYSLTQMQTTFGIIQLAIVNGEPKTLTLKEILKHYVDFQVEVVERRVRFDLKKSRERAHILEGLKKATDHVDEVIELIKSSKDQSEARQKLCSTFELDEIQAQAILQMRWGQLTGLEREKIENELSTLNAKIIDFEDILANKQRVFDIIKEELLRIKNKFGDDRRTEITAVSGEVDIEDLIPVEDCVVTLTKFGYMKRQSTENYRIQNRGGRGVSGIKYRQEDITSEMTVINSHDNILLFTNKGKVYRIKCYQIPEGSRTSKGTNIANILPIEQGENVTAMITFKEFDENINLVMVTKNARIKRIGLNAYNTNRKGGLVALRIEDNDELGWVKKTEGNNDVIVATKNGKGIRFNENEIRSMGRQAGGVRAITLVGNDEVVGMSVVDNDKKILTVTETGFGRLSDFSEYRCQSRGGKGTINYNTQKYGCVASIMTVSKDDDVIIMAQNGVIIRIMVSQIRECSRTSKGVKIMRIEDGNKVVAVAKAKHEDEVKEESIKENKQDTQE